MTHLRDLSGISDPKFRSYSLLGLYWVCVGVILGLHRGYVGAL